MAFDPELYGARCNECWLKDRREGVPVGPELKHGTSALVVLEYPSRDDYKANRPLTGDSGIEFNNALQAQGLTRERVSVTTVVCCHPEGGDMEKVLRQLQKENKKRQKSQEPVLPSPAECCRPRLHAEMRALGGNNADGTLNVITLGKAAYQGVARQTCSILDIRGGPHVAALMADGNVIRGQDATTEVTEVRALIESLGADAMPMRILPTLDPYLVTKARRWTRAFRADIGRAIRWFEGRLGWEEPWMILRPSIAQIEGFFSSLTDEVSYDVETDALEPMTANLRCIGFSTAEGGIIIPFLSRDGSTRFYNPAEESRIADLIRALMLEPTIFKIGHNQGSYDRMVIEHHFGVTPRPIIDGLVVHKSVEPELPHNLGYVGSMYTDVMAWKAGHVATEAKTDEELWKYCIFHGTMIELADGTSLPIHEIVEKKLPVEVMSRTASGERCARRVVAWHKQLMKDQEWKRIVLSSTMEGKRGLIATPEHEIHTTRGKIRADSVQVGDRVYINEPKLTDFQMSALLGTLCGDSVLAVSPARRRTPHSAKTAALAGGHRVVDGLAQHKAQVLRDIVFLAEKPYVPKARVIRGKITQPKEFVRIGSSMLHQFAQIRPLFYGEGGERRLRTETLDRLGAVGLAWWFMDDGCRQNGDKRKNGSDSIALSVQRYPKGDIEAARLWLEERFGRIYLGADDVLRFSIAASRDFCLHIAKHVPPPLRHKLPRDHDFPEYEEYVPPQEYDYATAVVVAAEDYIPKKAAPHQKLRARTRYCLTVEDTHNFMTQDGLVQNCLTDCVVVARSLPETMKAAQLRDQESVIAMDHRIQEICVGLHQNGQLVDQAVRHEHDIRLLKEAQKFHVLCTALAGVKGFNPGSAHQVRDLLFERWGLMPPPNLARKRAYTKSGDPSTGDDMILALRMSGFLNDGQKAFLDALRKYRKAVKLRGSYTLPLKPHGTVFELGDFAQELFDDPETPDEEAEAFFGDRFKKDNKKRGLVWADGRVRADYNIGPTTGRLSCSGGLNLQTPPEKLRDMFVPGDGMVFIYADADQLELRLIAALAGSERYLKIFNEGGDAHAVSASLAFGKKFDVLEKGSPDWESLRKFAKILSYASGYGAALETVLDVIRSVEDDKGNLVYANVSKNEARDIHSNWLQGAGVEEWWQRNMDTFRKQKFIREPVWGRRRDFLDGENFCEIQNFACQAGGAAIMHEAVLEIVENIPFQYAGPGTGLVNYMHDSVLVAVPEKDAEWATKIVNAAMNRTTPALAVRFTSKAKTKTRWSERKAK